MEHDDPSGVGAAGLPLADIERTARVISPYVVETPLLESVRLNDACGGRLLIKAECLQNTGSFKIRGALAKLSSMTAQQRSRGAVAFSSGNHGQGVAAAARVYAIPATIFMPSDSPRIKVDGTRYFGASIVFYDRYQDDREALAHQRVKATGGTLVRPYDDEQVMLGQATIGLEIARQTDLSAIDQVIVPVGGGGLVAGISSALKALRPSLAVYAAEPAACDDTARSLHAGRRLANNPDSRSICDALLTPTPGVKTFAINRQLLSGGLTASDETVMQAMALALSTLKIVLEPGGAIALAAALANPDQVRGRTTVIVASGGNIDASTYADIIQQAHLASPGLT